MRVYIALTLSSAASALALRTTNSHVVHEKRHAALTGWLKREALAADVKLPMRVGLTQSNINNGQGAALLEDLSNPHSARYGQWLSAEEVIDYFAPTQVAVDKVRSWLTSSGIAPQRVSLSANKQWIQFDAEASEAEELLKTKYHRYEHVGTGTRNIACEEYHIPSHLQDHIDYITPGIKLVTADKSSGKSSDGRTKRGLFSLPILENSPKDAITALGSSSTASAATTDLSTCDHVMVPACIAAMYNISQATKAAAGNELGIFEQGDYYSPTDLQTFFQTYAPNIPASTRPILKGIDGGYAPTFSAGAESNLDFQVSYPIIYPQNSVLFQTDDTYYASGSEGGGGFLNTFLDAIDGSYCAYSAYGETGNAAIDPVYPDPILLGYQGQLQCGVYNSTNVISISYGGQESIMPTNYQQRQCSEFMKLGLQGVSVVIASGDSGVASPNGTCLGNGEVFNPGFPVSCPYITAVGATYLPLGGDVHKNDETAVTRMRSGAGFSNIYPRPTYQDQQVTTYLAQHTPSYKTYNTSGTNIPPKSVTNGGQYNIGGRAYPDVSAIGDNVPIILNGNVALYGGTSSAAPVFAAVLNRINEERLAVGKRTVGFVNPLLYSYPEIFHDITIGNNSGCNTSGFYAAPGWDPVTGLGTPNYPKMLELFMRLP